MNDIFYNYYIKKIDDVKHITITKKKNALNVKDGLITFSLKTLNECTICGFFNLCDYRKCNHIYAVLINHYKLSYNDLFYLWKNDNYENLINNKPFDYSPEECTICLDVINYKNKYVHCLNCGICYHSKCINRCKDTKCLNCMNLLN